MFIVDVDSSLGFLRRVDVGNVADVSEVHAVSVFSVELSGLNHFFFENFGSLYL